MKAEFLWVPLFLGALLIIWRWATDAGKPPGVVIRLSDHQKRRLYQEPPLDQ